MVDFCSMEYDSITSVNTNKLHLYLHSIRGRVGGIGNQLLHTTL